MSRKLAIVVNNPELEGSDINLVAERARICLAKQFVDLRNKTWTDGVEVIEVQNGVVVKENDGKPVAFTEGTLVPFDGIVLVNFPQHEVIRFDEFAIWKKCTVFGSLRFLGLMFSLFFRKVHMTSVGNSPTSERTIILEPGGARAIRRVGGDGTIVLDEEDGKFIFNEGDKVCLSSLRLEELKHREVFRDRVFQITKCFPNRHQVKIELSDSDRTVKQALSKAVPNSGVLERVQEVVESNAVEPQEDQPWKSYRETVLLPHQERGNVSIWPGEESQRLRSTYLSWQVVEIFERLHGFCPEEMDQDMEILFSQFLRDRKMAVSLLGPGNVLVLEERDIDKCLTGDLIRFGTSRHQVVIDGGINLMLQAIKSEGASAGFCPGKQLLLFEVLDALEVACGKNATVNDTLSNADLDDMIEAKFSHLLSN